MIIELAIRARALLAALLVIALAATLAACEDDEDGGTSSASARERAFLTAMVPHHELAVDMAHVARRRAKHVELRELAQAIISTQELRKCIRLDLDCGDICDVTGRLLTRQTEYDAGLSQAQLNACREACATCAEECERHAEHHEHCRPCAEACRRCEQACARLFDAME